MSKIPKIVFMVLGSGFLWYRSYELIYAILINEPTLEGIENFFIAFLINLFLTGAIALPGFVFPTHRLIPSSYYEIKSADKLNKWCKLIGLKYFKTLLLLFFWGWKKNRKRYFNGTKTGLTNFIYQTKQSEFGHLLALTLIQTNCLIILFLGYLNLFVFATLINFVGNGYPILLQRQHRSRIQEILH